MTEPARFHGRAQLFRRNWQLLAAAFAPAVVGVGALYGVGHLGGWLNLLALVVGLVGLIAAPVVPLYVWFASPMPALESVKIDASDAQGLHCNGQLLLARQEMVAGFAFAHPDGTAVQLERRFRRPIELLLSREEDARALLRSLRLDASQAAVSVPLRSPAAGDWRRALGLLFPVGITLGTWSVSELGGSTTATLAFAAACVVGLLAWLVMMSVKARATVGADGVLVGFFFRKRFYAYSDIVRIDSFDQGLKSLGLVLKNGTTVRLTMPREWSSAQELTAAQRLLNRIEEAMWARHPEPVEADLEQLARKERPMREWLAHLRGVGAGAHADHRRAPVPVDRLWRIVEDATLDAAARAAAAIALGSSKGDETRARLRAVARATAAPRLRIALEVAANVAEEEGDEAESDKWEDKVATAMERAIEK